MQQPLYNNPTQSSYFSAFAQDGKIFVVTYEGTQQVGITMQQVQSLQAEINKIKETTDTYRDRLIELGEIEPEQNTEDLLKSVSKQLKESQELNQSLMQHLNSLKKAATDEPA